MSVNRASQSILNLGEGKGLVKISRMLLVVEMHLIFNSPSLTTSPQNFGRTSRCFVLNLAESFQMQEIAGLLSPRITDSSFMSWIPISLKISCTYRA